MRGSFHSGGKDDPLIPVCAACLCASCWQGSFYCDKFQEANAILKRRSELKALGLEHEGYWAEADERDGGT